MTSKKLESRRIAKRRKIERLLRQLPLVDLLLVRNVARHLLERSKRAQGAA